MGTLKIIMGRLFRYHKNVSLLNFIDTLNTAGNLILQTLPITWNSKPKILKAEKITKKVQVSEEGKMGTNFSR